MDCGWRFKWPPGKPPFFVKPNGEFVHFYVHNYVPYLNENAVINSCPANDVEADEEEAAVEGIIEPDECVPGNVGGASRYWSS
eukprot:11285991-Heterocapsa_arctica.AAC.1